LEQQHNPAPWLVFEPAWEPVRETGSVPAPALGIDSNEQFPNTEQVSVSEENWPPAWLDNAGIQIIRATRSWIQYGTVGFAVMCILIAAVEALFGR
jgi:hypothetical protein